MKLSQYIIAILCLTGCSHALPYKTADMPKGTLLYVKPISMSGTLSSRIEVDFTARLTEKDSANAVINFSLITARPVNKTSRVLLSDGTARLSETEEITKLFSEQKGNQWISRFSAKINITDFTTIIKSPSFQLTAYTSSGDYAYKSDKSWAKKSQQISDYIVANQ